MMSEVRKVVTWEAQQLKGVKKEMSEAKQYLSLDLGLVSQVCSLGENSSEHIYILDLCTFLCLYSILIKGLHSLKTCICKQTKRESRAQNYLLSSIKASFCREYFYKHYEDMNTAAFSPRATPQCLSHGRYSINIYQLIDFHNGKIPCIVIHLFTVYIGHYSSVSLPTCSKRALVRTGDLIRSKCMSVH